MGGVGVYMMNNPKGRHYGMESGDMWGGMNGGDCDYDGDVRVGDLAANVIHHRGQVVSYGVGRVDNIDVLVAY